MRIILVIIVFLVNGFSIAQTNWNYAEIDSLTYQQYVRKDYKQLQKTAKAALNNEIDFYYLRMRLGISFYEQNNFDKAQIHFSRAYEMNPADSVVQEYLYYTYINSLRTEDAYDLASKFNLRMQQKVGFKKIKALDVASTMDVVGVTLGMSLNDQISLSEGVNFLGNALYVENNVQGNNLIANVYLKNRLLNRLSVFNSFTGYSIESVGIVQSKFTQEKRDSYTTNTFQYNVGANYVFPKNWTVGGSFGYYYENGTFLTAKLNSSTFAISYSNVNVTNNAFSGIVYGSKRIRNLSVGITGSWANLGGFQQVQLEGAIGWYPFGNTKLYTVSSYSWLNNDGTNQSILSQKIGGMIFKNLWYEVKVSYGNHSNYLTEAGIFAFNTIEPILFLGEANLRLTFGRFSIIPSYTIQQRESSYSRYLTSTNSELVTANYFNHLIKTTLQWKF
ncbi:MAG: outer membrane beta-barrel protein [Fluviicola sp.]|nr:outer membrane beta-barrel protein [Fluviicola sp.]